jgi:hypothetical protein
MSNTKRFLFVLVILFVVLCAVQAKAFFTVTSRGEASTIEEAQAIALKEARNACGQGTNLDRYDIVRSVCIADPNKCVVELVGSCH